MVNKENMTPSKELSKRKQLLRSIFNRYSIIYPATRPGKLSATLHIYNKLRKRSSRRVRNLLPKSYPSSLFSEPR